jgi:hypothetical protein
MVPQLQQIQSAWSQSSAESQEIRTKLRGATRKPMNFSDATNGPVYPQEQVDQVMAEIRVQDRRRVDYFMDREWLKVCPAGYAQPLDYGKIDPANHGKVRQSVEWVQYPKGLFVVGPTGRAKTRAVWSAMHKHWLNENKIYCRSSFQLSQDAVKALTDHENGSRVMPTYVNPNILFLDDLGKRLTPSASQFLFEVIERRTSQMLPIMVTSNETPATLKEAINDPTMADPILRRIKEFCDTVVLL